MKSILAKMVLFGFAIQAINLWTPDVPTTLGKVPTKHETLNAADVQTWSNNGKQVLRITAGSTEVKAKVKVQQKVDALTPTAREVVVKEATKLLGPFPKSIYNNEEEKCELELSATTGVVVELFEL